MLFTLRNLRIFFISLMTILLSGVSPAKGVDRSPVGLWKTFDDRTHKARGIIRIYEDGGALAGRIESSFTPEEMAERCEKCSGDQKDAPIIGLVILRSMHASRVSERGAEYEGGEILDPETGSVYRCRFTLSSDGEKLFVRGYLAMSIFGRTQTWTRMEG